MEFSRKIIAKFQEQDCQLTLGEAVEEFYTVNEHKFSKPDPKTTWTELLVHHDVGHVFFGVNTTIMDEAAGDCWTLLGSDMTLKKYGKYANTPEGKKLIKEIGLLLILKSLLYSIPLILKIYMRSSRMNRKWEHKNYQEYMDRPLGELRKSFNLKILD